MVEQIRFDLMSEGDNTSSGYTLDELGQISDLVAEIESKSDENAISTSDVQRLVFLIKDQRRKRGVTLGMIETVADTVTRYYRERGFILAKAYIPEQKVRDGVVTLTILLGELGGVEVTNGNRVPYGRMDRIFSDILYQPVTSESMEEALYLVNDIPGVTAQGVFQPGSQVGDTKLNVNVVDEDWYTASLRFDNHGSKKTGYYRAYGDITVHNPIGYGDELSLAAYKTIVPDDTLYGAITYRFPLYFKRLSGRIGASSNDFIYQSIQNLSSSQIAGKAYVADFNLNYMLKRSRARNFSFDFNYAHINTTLTTEGNNNQDIITADNIGVGFNFDVLSEGSQTLHNGSVWAYYSNSEYNTDNNITPDLSVLYARMDYSFLTFMPFPFTDQKSRLVVRSSAQLAGQYSGSINQPTITGPTKARGYETSSVFFDDTIFAGFDWYLPLFSGSTKRFLGNDLSDGVQPYFLMDMGYGYLHDLKIAGSADSSYSGRFFDLGLGVNFNIYDVQTNFTFAVPISKSVGSAEARDRIHGLVVYGSLQYFF